MELLRLRFPLLNCLHRQIGICPKHSIIMKYDAVYACVHCQQASRISPASSLLTGNEQRAFSQLSPKSRDNSRCWYWLVLEITNGFAVNNVILNWPKYWESTPNVVGHLSQILCCALFMPLGAIFHQYRYGQHQVWVSHAVLMSVITLELMARLLFTCFN